MQREELLTGSAQPGDRPPADGRCGSCRTSSTPSTARTPSSSWTSRRTAAWLAHRGLPGAEGRVSVAELRRAVVVREALRTLLLANNGGADDPAGARAARRRGARAPPAAGVRLRRPGLRPAAGGVDAALGVVVAIAFTAMVDGGWARLKACPRDVCRWAFYDRSSGNRATLVLDAGVRQPVEGRGLLPAPDARRRLICLDRP